VNKVVKTKASAEATPPGTADPKDPKDDVDETSQSDPTEVKTDGEVFEEIKDRPHPFN
jgi:hypothetical protein